MLLNVVETGTDEEVALLLHGTLVPPASGSTAASISCGDEEGWSPASGSLLIRAEPTRFVSDEDASRLGARGIEVRSIVGAADTIWYSHFDEFLARILEMYQTQNV